MKIPYVKTTTLKGCFGFLLLFCSAFFGSFLVKAFILTVFWDWFVLPVFPAMPHLDLAKSLGLSFILSVFLPPPLENHKKYDEKQKAEVCFFTFFTFFPQMFNTLFSRYLFIFCMGWALHFFVH